ncbi:MAG: LysM peptidoglycan-binding domain-containing protein [Firmicutes bacterium]|nr:LysM peptidoglycan-binding domain-containing protein [Bacillota bacterium]
MGCRGQLALARNLSFGLVLVALLMTLACRSSAAGKVDPASPGGPKGVLRRGCRGDDVAKLQETLRALGLVNEKADGYFGPKTEQAVRSFQRTHGLPVDGVAGPKTRALLQAALARRSSKIYVVKPGDTLFQLARRFNVSVSSLAKLNGISNPAHLEAGQKLEIPGQGALSRGSGGVELLPWSIARTIYTSTATVIDVRTGLSFRVRRRGGYNHADSEPLTTQDTAIMKRIYGGKWSWERRPIILEVRGRRLAASMNGMPHGGDVINGNDFDGHFCIHFLGSKTHGSSRVDPQHQAAIRFAAGQ